MTFDALKARLTEAWGAAPWEPMAASLAPMHDHLVAALAPRSGERWLDVATGTGAVALRAARAGAEVTAQDLSPRLVERARELAAEEGLAVRFDVGDAEDLPYPDASFDVVSSAVGAILTPDHSAMAHQLTRTCRSDGRLGLTAWRPGVEPFQIAKRFQPPPEPGAGDRENWGREEYVRVLLDAAFELSFEPGDNTFVGSSGEELWKHLVGSAGPMKVLFESLEPERRGELREEVTAYYESHRAGDQVRAPAAYLLILGRRR